MRSMNDHYGSRALRCSGVASHGMRFVSGVKNAGKRGVQSALGWYQRHKILASALQVRLPVCSSAAYALLLHVELGRMSMSAQYTACLPETLNPLNQCAGHGMTSSMHITTPSSPLLSRPFCRMSVEANCRQPCFRDSHNQIRRDGPRMRIKSSND